MNKNLKVGNKHLIIIIIAISIGLMIYTFTIGSNIRPVSVGVNYVIIPLQKGVTYFGDFLRHRVEFLKNINELDQINDTLEKKVNQLEYENKVLALDKLELERLRSLYDLDKQYADYPKTGARVIGKNPGSWYDVFVIDKGENQGIKKNQIVLSDGGLCGRIIETGPDYAKVRTIVDDTSSVSSMVLRTSDLCVVSGKKVLQDDGNALIEFIENDANIVVGDEIVTSHLGEIYPKGILIGTVKSVEISPNKLTKTAVLEPTVDFKHIEEVLVIIMDEDNQK